MSSVINTGELKFVCEGCSSPLDIKDRKPFSKAVCVNCLSETTVPLQINNYVLDRQLSFGDYTAVYSGRETTGGSPLRAVKLHGHMFNVFKKYDGFPAFEFTGGVKYLDTAVHGRELYIFTELPAGKAVRDYLNGGVNEENVAVIIYSACRIMADAANSGIRHGNLTLDSLWVSENGEVLISDFMIHQTLLNANDNKTNIDGILNIPYIDNSILAGEESTEKSDMFSLGVCFYQMLTNFLPHDIKVAEEIVAARKQNPFTKEALEEKNIEKPLITVVMGLLKGEFLCFKEVREFIKHRIFNGEAPAKNDKGRTKVVVKKKNPLIPSLAAKTKPVVKAKSKPVLKVAAAKPGLKKSRTLSKAGTKSISKAGTRSVNKSGTKSVAKAGKKSSVKNKTGVKLPKAKNPKKSQQALKKFFK
jgi:serine/threonine protein kinase